MKKLVSLALALVLILSLAACGGGSTSSAAPASQAPAGNSSSSQANTPAPAKDPVKIVYADATSTTHAQYTTMEYIADEVNKRTDGRYVFELHTASSLGDEKDVAEGVMLGTIDMCSTGTSVLASYAPEIDALNLPFIIQGDEHATALFYGEVGQKFLDMISEKCAVHSCLWATNGFRITVTTNKQVDSLADLKGLKIRTTESEMHVKLWEMLGTIPTAIASSEAFTALQQGAIDGYERLMGGLIDSGMYEIINYCAMTNHVYTPAIYIMNEDLWNSIPAEDQAIFTEVFQEAGLLYDKSMREYLAGCVDILENAGVTVTYPDLAEFRAAVAPIYDSYKNLQEGIDLINSCVPN